jgi:hypothetical protein
MDGAYNSGMHLDGAAIAFALGVTVVLELWWRRRSR